MKVRKNALSRIMAFLMAVVMIAGLIPVNSMTIVEAANDSKPVIVNVDEKEVYLYGVEDAKDAVLNADDNYEIEYETNALEEPVLYVGGEEVRVSETDPVVEYQDNKIILDKEWVGTQSLWVAVSFGIEFEEIDERDISIKNNSKEFNEEDEAVPAVEVEIENGEEDDIILYSEDGGKTFSKEVSKIKNVTANPIEVIVKIVRIGCVPYVADKEIVEVSAAGLNRTDLTITPYNGTYNYQEAPVFDITGYDEEKDTVWFSTDGGMNYTKMNADKTNIPTIKEPGEKKIFVKITRDNYKDYVTSFTAKVITAGINKESIKIPKYDKNPVYSEGTKYEIIPGEIEGLLPGDMIQYAEKGSSIWTVKEPEVGVAGTHEYVVRIIRKHHDVLDLAVTVTVDKAVQEVDFKETPSASFIYNDKDNTFIYEVGEVKGGSTVTYSLDSASEAIADINPETGKVTYYAVGDIKVNATITNDNYDTVKIDYTAKVIYAEGPDYTESEGLNDLRNYSSENPYKVTPVGEWEIIANNNSLGQTGWSEKLEYSTEGEYSNLYVAFRNKETKEITALEKVESFVIDNTAPVVNGFEFTDKNEGIIPSLIRTLSFGLFCKEGVVVEVFANDVNSNNVATGIKEIKLYQYTTNNEKIELKANENDPYKFLMDVGFEGTIKAEVIDYANNTSTEVLANCLNSNMGDENLDGYIMIENTAPVISGLNPVLVENDESSTEIEENPVYSGDVKFDIEAYDEKSGLALVTVTVNGEKIELYKSTDKKEHTSKDDSFKYTLSTEGRTADEDGKFDISLVVVDNAGVVSEDQYNFYEDTTYPVITNFEFSVKDKADANIESDGDKFVLVKDYGFYFRDYVTVTISAEDSKADNEMVTGVDTITYKAVDINGKIAAEGTKTVDKDNKISFDIEKNFKGQIYAYATDKVKNNPTNSTKPEGYDDSVLSEGFVHPDGTVVENEEQHLDTSVIDFVVPETGYTQLNTFTYNYDGSVLDKYAFDNNENIPLYNKNVTFTIDVQDTYSGIEEVKWSVVKGKGLGDVVKQETLDVDNAKELEEAEWTVEKEAETNLIVGLKKEITIEENVNDMVLLVELKDNAGNTSHDYYRFGIDKKAPVVSISYKDNASGDANYFNETRKAEVVVKDWNFNTEDFVVAATRVTDSGEKIEFVPKVSWSSSTTGAEHNTTYTGTITYLEEGDYTFKVVSCTDRATNSISDSDVTYNGESPKKFTIDKTNPTISVSYNNNNAQNGKYFKENRTATVVVKEHNFDVDKVKVTLTARKNGSTINVPGVSWSHNGNTHTATIAYNNDGDYTFDIQMTDKAGRENEGVNYGNSVAEKEFTVDTTIEDPIIDGVKDGNAYTDEVIPTIKFDDINFENVEVKLVRTVKGQKNVDVTKEFVNAVTKNSQGGSGRFDTFKKIAENDGIYTLTVKMTDKAGNKSEKSITFTVNRYGSVYVFDDYLVSLQDSYVKEVDGDIILTEYNANRLVKDSLKIEITKDGQPIANPVYKVSPVINNEVSVGSSGWYQYEYVIAASNFTEDGVYRITVASEDAAGNKPETENYDDCKMVFSVDSTPAEITNIAGLENPIVNADSLEFSMEVFDAIGLKSVTVYVNGEIAEVFDNMEDLINFVGSYELGAGSNQEIRIVVEDLAGNITDTAAEDFTAEYEFNSVVTVSTNFFVRWFANKPLFIGSIVGIVAAAGAGIWLAAGKKRKKDEEA